MIIVFQELSTQETSALNNYCEISVSNQCTTFHQYRIFFLGGGGGGGGGALSIKFALN